MVLDMKLYLLLGSVGEESKAAGDEMLEIVDEARGTLFQSASKTRGSRWDLDQERDRLPGPGFGKPSHSGSGCSGGGRGQFGSMSCCQYQIYNRGFPQGLLDCIVT